MDSFGHCRDVLRGQSAVVVGLGFRGWQVLRKVLEAKSAVRVKHVVVIVSGKVGCCKIPLEQRRVRRRGMEIRYCRNVLWK